MAAIREKIMCLNRFPLRGTLSSGSRSRLTVEFPGFQAKDDDTIVLIMHVRGRKANSRGTLTFVCQSSSYFTRRR